MSGLFRSQLSILGMWIAISFAADASVARPGSEFKKIVINAKSDFEAAGVADFDGDGKLDIVSGDVWYAGPDFQKRHPIVDIARKGGYRVDFANVPLDVDGDGRVDIISCNWHERSVVWRRNPGSTGKPWTEILVDRPGNSETAIAADVDGDGRIDFLPDVAQKTIWYRIEKGTLKGYVVSPKIGGHGIGLGDVNGDGRADILKPGGWFEAPADRLAGKWKWHGEWSLGAAGISIIAHDFTGDGLADVVWGMGHDFGRFWLEQKKTDDPAKKWVRHEIDRDWSQAHALVLTDLDGDGRVDILTGKRKFAHNGNDPGGKQDLILCLYVFDNDEKSFKRQVLHRGGNAGLGLAPVVVDIDGDGDLDFVAPGKSGLFLFRQEK